MLRHCVFLEHIALLNFRTDYTFYIKLPIFVVVKFLRIVYNIIDLHIITASRGCTYYG